MSHLPKLTHYVSEIDQFLQSFDHENTKLSKSQQKEKAKYSRIYLLRDDATADDKSQTLWDQF